MAPKRSSPPPPPAEDPPSSSSSESEEESEEVSSDEEVTPAPPPPPARTQKPKKDTKPSSSSVVVPPRTTVEAKSRKDAEEKLQSSDDDDDEEDDETDSSSESDDPSPPQKLITNLNAKPTSSKAAVAVPDPSSSKEKPKSVLKPTVAALAATAPKKFIIKRPVEASKDGNDPKRAKKKDGEASDPVTPEKKVKEKDGEAGDHVESGRKPLFQRLWSEEDEIVILNGIIDFISERGVDPLGHIEAFYEFIHKSLASGGSRPQLADKIRRMKKKYINHASKLKHGKDKVFSNSHEQLSYDLSKNIWGDEVIVNGGSIDHSKSNGNGGKSVPKSYHGLPQQEFVTPLQGRNEGLYVKDEANDLPWFHQGVGFAGLDESFMKQGLELIDGAKKAELKEKWKNLLVAETELFVSRSDLIREQAMLVLNAYKKQ